MARGKAINVKIATVKVIKALETRLAELEKNYAEQGKNEAKHLKAYEAWKKEVGKWAIENFSKAENLRTNYRSWNNNLNVDFDIVVKQGDFPQEPEKDFEVIHTHSYNETLSGYTYQVGDLFTTSKTGVTGRIYSFAPVSKTVTRVGLQLANGSKRFAMVKTSK